MLRATGTKCPAGTVQLSANFEAWILRESSLWAASLLAEPSATLHEETLTLFNVSCFVKLFCENVGSLKFGEDMSRNNR